MSAGDASAASGTLVALSTYSARLGSLKDGVRGSRGANNNGPSVLPSGCGEG